MKFLVLCHSKCPRRSSLIILKQFEQGGDLNYIKALNFFFLAKEPFLLSKAYVKIPVTKQMNVKLF